VPSPATAILIGSTLLALIGLVGFLAFVHVHYSPIVGRIFEEKPMFLPLRVDRPDEGEDVRFATSDGLSLAGTYLKARTPDRRGVVVYCHEYLGNRWGAIPYAGHLRDQGFDLFTFDFRNHGESPADADYDPLQWVTEHELLDIEAALGYVRSRPDADPAGAALFGVSRGGGAALCVAAREPRVWGVVTDGAFPTRGTMLAYILRWAEIYVSNPYFWRAMPTWVFEFVGWTSRKRTERKLRCRYAGVERAAARLAPRPWLAIHGEKDAYIGVDIARALFDRAGEPKELWIVKKAKHNRSREQDPDAYADRVSRFFREFGPRGPARPTVEVRPEPAPIVEFAEIPTPQDLGVAVPG
jgi:pimeloyl-ACP methyl ester carboxylesterase